MIAVHNNVKTLAQTVLRRVVTSLWYGWERWCGMLSIATGYDPRYLTGQVAKGQENYYTAEVGRGEPPGVWYGKGAAALGLSGQVDDTDMQGLYTHFVDPRDPLFQQGPHGWRRAPRLGRRPRKYTTAEQLWRKLCSAEPDAEPERLTELKRLAERRARAPVAFLDVTFGVPKSVSILHTALRSQESGARRAGDQAAAVRWAGQAELVEQAVWAGNNAALAFLQDRAGYSRAGYHGTRTPTGASVGRWIDAHDWVVASFWQHTSRNEDMHLHIHNAVLNRVQCADGVWRTLDSRAIHRMRGAAGAIAERVLSEQLVASLGVQWRWCPDGHTLELVGISPQARALFSSRRRAVTGHVAQLVARFEQRRGRAPNLLELSQLSLEASKATRPGKKRHKEDHDARLDRWERELRTSVDQTLGDIARSVPGRLQRPVIDFFDPGQVIAGALALVQGKKSAWTRYDLIRALNQNLPPCLGGLDTRHVIRVLDELADRALTPTHGSSDVVCLAAPDLVAVPPELRHANGGSVFGPPADLLYATQAHLAGEEALAEAGAVRVPGSAMAVGVVSAELDRLRGAGTELGADQTAAITGLLTSDRLVTVLEGPAGTGKSVVLGQICHLWTHHRSSDGNGAGGRVIGLATAQQAAHVLAAEGFPTAMNITRWLLQQTRLDTTATPSMENSLVDSDRLRAGDLVVVDEAGMCPTADLVAVVQRCRAAGARLIVCGDRRQLQAVGAAGGLALIGEAAPVHILEEVRRFTNRWEGQASLRLRDGDHTVISDYERHGRLVDAHTGEHAAELACRAWLADTLSGHTSLLLVATSEQAAELSGRLRARLVDLGHVHPHGVPLHHEAATGTVAGVGDIIQTRHNHWQLRDSAGRPVINRDLWQVTALLPDGVLRAQRLSSETVGTSGMPTTSVSMPGAVMSAVVDLPGWYVADHVALGYAMTVHAAQGSTVDTCYPIITPDMTPNSLYVAMTRGRRHNVAHVITTGAAPRTHANPSAAGNGTSAGIRSRIRSWFSPAADPTRSTTPDPTRSTPGQVWSAILDRTGDDLPALHLQRDLLTAAASMPVLAARRSEALTIASRQRFRAITDQLVTAGVLPDQHHRRLMADEALGPLLAALRHAELAGHDPQQVLHMAIAARELDTAASVAEVLHHRITNRYTDQLVACGDSWTERTPAAGGDPIGGYAHTLAQAMDHRCHTLGVDAATNPPAWATVHIGPIPESDAGRQEWVRRAGIVAGYRELHTAADDTDPIGACPPPATPDAHPAWFAAWRALDRPAALAAESTMTTADLVAAVESYRRELAWAPDWVADTMQATRHAAREHHQTGALEHAHARRDTDPAVRLAGLEQAAEYAAIAGRLHTQAAQLESIDNARQAWHHHTQPQRQAAARAAAELARRGLDPRGQPQQQQLHGGEQADLSTVSRGIAAAFPTNLNTATVKAQAAHQHARDTRPAHSRSRTVREEHQRE